MYFVLTKIVEKKHRNLTQLFIFHFWYLLVSQSCLTLCNPMDCSPPGSSVHRILQARILEWVVIPFSRKSSWPRGWIQFSYISGRLPCEPLGKPLCLICTFFIIILAHRQLQKGWKKKELFLFIFDVLHFPFMSLSSSSWLI